MTLQWTFVATVLYVEIAITTLLMLPFISSYRWQRIFRSRLLSAFRSYANIYFNVFIVILIILFLDAIREVRAYSVDDDDHLHSAPGALAMQHMKLFRAQRNLYIAGYTMFLFLVIRKLVTLISHQASLEADNEAIKKQASSATETAKKFMSELDNKTNEQGAKNIHVAEVEKAKKEVEKLNAELELTKRNFDALKKQAESTNREYDRLSEEHSRLQNKLLTAEGKTEGKKDD